MSKLRVFSRYSDPAIDKPLLHKSQSYVDSLLLTGEAILTECGHYKLTGWVGMRHENADQEAKRKLDTPLALEGANSCRMVNGMLQVRPFPNYEIPACGARNRPMSAKIINHIPPTGPLVWQMNT